jgi:hypothetical protein
MREDDLSPWELRSIAAAAEYEAVTGQVTNKASIAKFKDELRKVVGAGSNLDLSVIPALGEVLAEVLTKVREIDGDLAEHFADNIRGLVLEAAADPDDSF